MISFYFLCFKKSYAGTFFDLRPLFVRVNRAAQLLPILWPALCVPCLDAQAVNPNLS